MMLKEKHWTNTKSGKDPLPAHKVTAGKSAEDKALINRYTRRKRRVGLRDLYLHKVVR